RMSTLVVVGYDDLFTAEEVRLKLWKMQKDYLIDMADAVVAVKDQSGKVKLHQAVNLTGLGAVSGGFWGALIGLIFLNPLLGMAVGATAGGGSGGPPGRGDGERLLKEAGPGPAAGAPAPFLLVRKAPPRRAGAVRPGPKGHPGAGARGGEGDGRKDPEDIPQPRGRGQAPGGAERGEAVAGRRGKIPGARGIAEEMAMAFGRVGVVVAGALIV